MDVNRLVFTCAAYSQRNTFSDRAFPFIKEEYSIMYLGK